MEISFEKFMELLRGYGTAMNAETYKNLQNHDGEGIQFCLEHGCAVMVENYAPDGYGIYIGVYQTLPDGDIALVTEEQIKKAKEYFRIYNNPEVHIKSGVVSNGPLPEKWDRLHGWRCYARKGKKYEADPRIKKLTFKDVPSIKAFFEPYLCSEDNYECAEAKTITWQADHFEKIADGANGCFYGFYEHDELCGVATTCCIKELNIVWLMDIFVASQHRKKGIGKALVLAALGQWPNNKWIYQASRDNMPSTALAKSLGFALEGAALTQVVKPD